MNVSKVYEYVHKFGKCPVWNTRHKLVSMHYTNKQILKYHWTKRHFMFYSNWPSNKWVTAGGKNKDHTSCKGS